MLTRLCLAIAVCCRTVLIFLICCVSCLPCLLPLFCTRSSPTNCLQSLFGCLLPRKTPTLLLNLLASCTVRRLENPLAATSSYSSRTGGTVWIARTVRGGNGCAVKSSIAPSSMRQLSLSAVEVVVEVVSSTLATISDVRQLNWRHTHISASATSFRQGWQKLSGGNVSCHLAETALNGH